LVYLTRRVQVCWARISASVARNAAMKSCHDNLKRVAWKISATSRICRMHIFWNRSKTANGWRSSWKTKKTKADVIFHWPAAVGVQLIGKARVRTNGNNEQRQQMVLDAAAGKRATYHCLPRHFEVGIWKEHQLPPEDADLVLGTDNQGPFELRRGRRP